MIFMVLDFYSESCFKIWIFGVREFLDQRGLYEISERMEEFKRKERKGENAKGVEKKLLHALCV